MRDEGRISSFRPDLREIAGLLKEIARNTERIGEIRILGYAGISYDIQAFLVSLGERGSDANRVIGDHHIVIQP
jgi:hypothetical protein